MVALIAERDSGHCARCGLAAPASRRQIHHRKPRGAGGRREAGRFTKGNVPNASLDFPENLVLLCGSISTDPESCHYQVEHHRNMAQYEGWLVHEWEDPKEKPILARDGQWHTLVDDQWDPMLLPVTMERTRALRWSRGPERNATRRDGWREVHGQPEETP